MVYKYEDVLRATLEYFDNDELASDAWIKKYALKNNSDEFMELTPDDMHWRMARQFARIEQRYLNPIPEEEIYGYFKDFKWIVPQGSPMSAIGNEYRYQSLSNCFVIDSPYDSYGGIMKTDEEEAQIMKRRGGVGFDISTIRPKGLPTANAAGTTDGIGVFMQRYSNTTKEVAQGGRRGALMIACSVHHPEIETFITIKRDLNLVTSANVSIKLTDEFMRAVKEDREYEQRFPVQKDAAKHVVKRMVNARELWNKIIASAHAVGDPGLLFWDRVIELSPADAYADLGFETLATNPCGELPLCADDSCRLLLQNLYSFVIDPFLPSAKFDWDKFKQLTQIAQRLSDDLVDLEIEAIERILNKIDADPEPAEVKRRERELWETIKTKTSQGRRTGLGITGLGDCLAALGIKYGSKKSIKMTEEIYRTMAVESYRSSCEMARDRGPFPIYDHAREVNHPFIQRVLEQDDALFTLHSMYGRRNIADLTTSPAGTASLETKTTNGVEGATFVLTGRRRKVNAGDTNSRVDYIDDYGEKWQEYTFTHPKFKVWMDVTGKTDVKESPYHGAMIDDVDWVASVELLAAAQRWVDHSISKTVNLPEDVSPDVVNQCYMKAWESGCKGCTVYRAGSKGDIIVDASKKRPGSKTIQPKKIIESHAPKRPVLLSCDVHKCSVKGEAWTVIVGLFDNKPYEIFGGLSKFIEIPRKVKKGRLKKNGKKDGIATYNLEFGDDDDMMIIKDIVDTFENLTHGAFTRTISLSLRHGVPVEFICEQLTKDKHSDMQSFSRAIARVLKTYIKDGTLAFGEKCPNCESQLVYQAGCSQCTNCAWSRCS